MKRELSMVKLLTLLSLCATASATGGDTPHGANQTLEYLLELTASSRPACAWPNPARTCRPHAATHTDGGRRDAGRAKRPRWRSL